MVLTDTYDFTSFEAIIAVSLIAFIKANMVTPSTTASAMIPLVLATSPHRAKCPDS
ncbi:hypothetical protein M3J09_013108 [Ascochyta lentis]